MITPENKETLAAVDLGSNSFHMIISSVSDGHVTKIDRLREQVQLAAGVDEKCYLSDEAMERGIACLERFGQRVEGLRIGQVRAVGTNTLRKIKNRKEFLQRATRALGHPVEVIAGREEARLIYLGVAQSEADDAGRRLVIDIGGGSTEFIIGERFETVKRESLYMGCVTYSKAYFPDGTINEQNMKRAEMAAQLELQGISQEYRTLGWEDCVGSSGTIKAIRTVLETQGWSEGDITRKGLQKIRKALIKAGSFEALEIDGLNEERRAVFAGGVAVLVAIFDTLGIGHMHVSEGALREGVIFDLLGRLKHEDVREGTVMAMAKRYHVVSAWAEQVSNTLDDCVRQVRKPWNLGNDSAVYLRWSAFLLRIGLNIAHSQFHKHGGYIIKHSDMRGFSRQEQSYLSFLVRAQRRKFPKAELAQFNDDQQLELSRLAILLRLASIINYGRHAETPPLFNLTVEEQRMHISFPSDWLDDHPLSRLQLKEEAQFLKAIKFKLKFE